MSNEEKKGGNVYIFGYANLENVVGVDDAAKSGQQIVNGVRRVLANFDGGEHWVTSFVYSDVVCVDQGSNVRHLVVVSEDPRTNELCEILMGLGEYVERPLTKIYAPG